MLLAIASELISLLAMLELADILVFVVVVVASPFIEVALPLLLLLLVVLLPPRYEEDDGARTVLSAILSRTTLAAIFFGLTICSAEVVYVDV